MGGGGAGWRWGDEESVVLVRGFLMTKWLLTKGSQYFMIQFKPCRCFPFGKRGPCVVIVVLYH